MKKIFIDLGSYKGDTIESAIKTMPNFDKYLGFEPVKELNDIAFERVAYNPKVSLFNIAAGLEDGEVDFYVDTQKGKTSYTGSTLMKDKITGVLVKRRIQSINFPKWLREYMNKDDFIVLKIDIEGFEYILLEKLLEEGLDLINVLYVEWHWKKIKSITEERHNKLIVKLRCRGYKIDGIHDEFGVLIKTGEVDENGIKKN